MTKKQQCMNYIRSNYRIGSHVNSSYVAKIVACSVRTVERAMQELNECGVMCGTRIVWSTNLFAQVHPMAARMARTWLAQRGIPQPTFNQHAINAVLERGGAFNGEKWEINLYA